MDKTKVVLKGSPPIPEERKTVYQYYQLTFDDDGCPMKQMPDGKVFHPILGAYLIVDYMRWYKTTHDYQYYLWAMRIAELVMAKAEKYNDALVFWYTPESKLSYIPGKFYSALTQANYIKALCILRPYSQRRSKKTWNTELQKLFNSFLISVKEGGILIKKDFGWILEEYPHKIPLYTLNGWLTALRCFKYSQDQLLQVGIDVKDFLNKNINAVKTLLPLYDARFCYNSRYQLTGFSRIKLVFDKPVPYSLEKFEIEIPGEGIFSGHHEKQDTRWVNYLERCEARILQFNIVRSLVSFPKPNIFRSHLTTNQACVAKVFVADGDYYPNLTAMPTKRWLEIETLTIPANDPFIFEVKIPFDDYNIFAYPTNFKKVINSQNYNAYHFIHILDLAELYDYSSQPLFKEYANKWLHYLRAWSDFFENIEMNLSYIHYVYGDDFEKIIENLLHQ